MLAHIDAEAKKVDGILSDMTIGDEKERLKDAAKTAKELTEEIVAKGEVYDALKFNSKINNQNRKIKQMDDVLGTLAKQQKKIFEHHFLTKHHC